MNTHVLWFHEIGKHDLNKVGGKGANLGELTQAGFNVPEGFVVNAETYNQFIEAAGIKPTITEILASLDVNDANALNQTAQTIKTLITQAPIPDSIGTDIVAAYQHLKLQISTSELVVAVRSSATAEDLPGASFAGQQATFLNVLGEQQLLTAVQACWASLFEARAIFYRNEKNFDHNSVAIAVVVQRMVQSEKSGIMFTVDPISNNPNTLLIEAGLGLGESIVSGEITPDEYFVDKRTIEVSDRTINTQEWKIVRRIDADSNNLEECNEKISVPDGQKAAQKLTEHEIELVAKLGLSIERHYDYPQDTEWALEHNTLYIVQARPITTLPDSFQQPAPQTTAPHTTSQSPEPQPAMTPSETTTQQANTTTDPILKGSSASPGSAAGKVRILPDPRDISTMQPGEILVARMTTPDYVPAMKKAAAIITDAGGRTCHAAIVSRELGIPCIVGAEKATTTLHDDQEVTVNATLGVVYEGRQTAMLSASPPPIPTANNTNGTMPPPPPPITATKVYVNLAAPSLATSIAAQPVDGVGLLRAEFIIADIGEHPRKLLDEGREAIFIDKLGENVRSIAQALYPRPVVYRFTDFKTNEYRNLAGGDAYEPHEENPMIGYRGCARYLKEPDLFHLEIDMVKHVREQGLTNLWVMLPFVRTVDELDNLLWFLDEQELSSGPDFKIWMMVEVPSNVILIEDFLALGIDGVSIGSNDLTQLTLGIDRDNAELQERFDERDPAVLASIQRVVTACQKHNVTCSICGQGPSVYPELTEQLVEWGVTSVSINPDMISQTQRIIARAEQKLILKHIRQNTTI